MWRLMCVLTLLALSACAKKRTDREWCELTNFAVEECMRAGHQAMDKGQAEIARGMFSRACAAGHTGGCYLVYHESKAGGRLPERNDGRGNVNAINETCQINWVPMCNTVLKELFPSREQNDDYALLMLAGCDGGHDKLCEEYLYQTFVDVKREPELRDKLQIFAIKHCDRGLLTACALTAQLDFEDGKVEQARASSLASCKKRSLEACRVYALTVDSNEDRTEPNSAMWAMCDLGSEPHCKHAKSAAMPRPAQSLLNPPPPAPDTSNNPDLATDSPPR